MMSRLLIAVLAACMWSGVAQAQNYTKISGADLLLAGLGMIAYAARRKAGGRSA